MIPRKAIVKVLRGGLKVTQGWLPYRQSKMSEDDIVRILRRHQEVFIIEPLFWQGVCEGTDLQWEETALRFLHLLWHDPSALDEFWSQLLP